MLNIIWLSFFVSAFFAALFQQIFLSNPQVWQDIVGALFQSSTLAFEISLGLVGTLCLWLGFLNIAQKAGLIDRIAKWLTPLFTRLMPGVPKNHAAHGSMTMNLAANMLGLDNAATPLGIKAMKDLQGLNKTKETATNAQILFLVLNTSSVTLLPITVFLYRAQLGAVNPTDVFLPILLATSASTFAGLLAVAWIQKINLFDRVIFAYLGGFALLITFFMLYFSGLSSVERTAQSSFLGNFILFGLVILFLVAGQVRKVAVYEEFVDGAKQGFDVAVRIIPYLVAMLVGIAVLRASGVLDGVIYLIEQIVLWVGGDTRFIPALPTAIMKPFSGSGARAMMIETMSTYGADSFPGLISSVIQGSTETTFYVLAVYFGSVGIKNVRHAVICGLAADIVGIITAILIGYYFFS